MRIDPNDEHEVLLDQKWNAATGTPDAGMPFLFRATPQHRTPARGLIAQKPTLTAAGHSRDHSPAPSTLRTHRSACIRSSIRAIGASVRRGERCRFGADSDALAVRVPEPVVRLWTSAAHQ